MLNFKNEYFTLEKGRLKYPTQFKDKSFLVVYGSKEGGITGTELTAHIFKVPENYYEINAGQLDFSNYPNGIENDFLTIRVTNLDSLFSLPLNFTDWKDISPENLTTTFEKIGESILDIQKRLSEVAVYIDSGKPDQINLPKLQVGCTWYKDQDENIVALPISDLYIKFQQMIDKLHMEVQTLLNKDYANLTTGLNETANSLTNNLNNLEKNLAKAITDLTDTKLKDILTEAEKQIELIVTAGGGLAPRVETLEKENATNKNAIAKKLEKGEYTGTAEELDTEIKNNSKSIDELNEKLLPKFSNYKGVYNQATTYKNGDVVLVKDLEEGYCFEVTNPEMADSNYPKLLRKAFKVNPNMYFKMIDNEWEIIFEKEEDLELYTIPQKGTTQDYKSTFDNYYPFSKMGRVLLKNGVEQYELDFNDSTKKKDGNTSVLTGADGDVMVRIPKFYCNCKKTPKGNRYRIFTFENPTKTLPLDLKPHPLFEGRNVYYTAAYNGYVQDNVLKSISGVSPTVNRTISSFRDVARQGRDTKYNITSIDEHSALFILYLIEFADLNSQKILGQGRSNTSSLSATGTTNALGNRSGRISNDDANGNVSYRGKEDIFGNIWNFVDGLLLTDVGYYYTRNPLNYGDKAKMTLYPAKPKVGDGYVSKIEWIKGIEHLIIPCETNGSATTYYCDNLWAHQTGEENIVLAGGSWGGAAAYGVACLDCDNVASLAWAKAGARLSYAA